MPASDTGASDAAADATPVVVAPAPAPEGPGLVLTVEPAEAELIIEGESYGPVSALQTSNGLLPLKPGIYQVALKLPGYVSWRAEVTVNESPEPLTVSLQKQ